MLAGRPHATSTATGCWPADRVRGVHHQRQRLPVGHRPGRRRRRGRRWSMPASRCPGVGGRCDRVGSRCRTGSAVFGSTGRATGRPDQCRSGRLARDRPVERTPSTATCCSSPAAGTRPCTCTARPAARCATTPASAPSCRPAGGQRPGRRRRRRRVRPGRLPGRRCQQRGAGAGRTGSRRGCRCGSGGCRPARRWCQHSCVWAVPAGAGEPRSFVDLQRDATVADVLRATGAGLRSVEHVKRYTTIGTAHDQGKTSGRDRLGHRRRGARRGRRRARHRPPSGRPTRSVAFAALAGRDRGELLDPVRVTAIHGWHVAHGAVFENVGQWKRPWYYPQRRARTMRRPRCGASAGAARDRRRA